MLLRILVLSVGIGVVGASASEDVAVSAVSLPNLPLGLVTFQKGRALNLSVSTGAGAFRQAGDPPGRIWTVTDRGPVLDCTEEREATGEDRAICPPDRRGKIYLLPGYAPAIYSIDVSPENGAKFIEMIILRGSSGRPLTGLGQPTTAARAEAAVGMDGRALESDPSGVEPGALVRLADGSFWIAEKFGPSLLEVAPDGKVRRRLVPAGTEDEFRGADYPVEGALPAILAQRSPGRGPDALALSPDEQFLYFAGQSALSHPGPDSSRYSPAIRVWKIDRTSGQVAGTYVYKLDPPVSTGDGAVIGRSPRQGDVRVAEMTAVGPDRLLVLERMRSTARLFLVTLDPERQLPPAYQDDRHRPALEELYPDVYEIAGVLPLRKQLLVDSDRLRGLAGRPSGMAVLSAQDLIVMSTALLGEGTRAQMFRITFPAPVLR